MEKRVLGNTGITVSMLGLGTVKFGRNSGVKYPTAFNLPNDREIETLLACAQEQGINFLDTAPAYGTSEERIGKILQGKREDWIISTKAGEEFENGVSAYNFSPTHIEDSLHRSLKRLKTDYIDMFLIHSDGRDLEILSDNALLKKLYEFKKSGLVRAIGASTKTPAGGLKALEYLDVVMATYTKEYTQEKTVLDYAHTNNKGVLLKKVFSSGHTQNPAECLSFAFSHSGASSAIIGTINPKHLLENVRALQHLAVKP